MNTLYIQYKLGDKELKDVVVKVDEISHAWEIKEAIKKKHQIDASEIVKIITLTKTN